jgi:pyruvate dehydrogenase E2 component (dihydrolipoamide acetyltransferase)
MPVSVTMPRLGESVTEGTVTRWLKREGDRVEADEPLLEVSTDKVDTEIPSPAAGVLSKIVVGEDETAEVGSELAVIAGDGEPAQAGQPSSGAAQAAAAGEATATGEAAGASDAPPAGSAQQEARAGSAEQETPAGSAPQQPAPAAEPAAEAAGAPAPAQPEAAATPAETQRPPAEERSAQQSPATAAPAEPAAGPGPGDGLTGGQSTVVTMPALGESVTEGTVTRWLKQVGDAIEADEPLLEVSTDKVDTEIPAPAGGTLLEIKAAEDETVAVGAPLAVIGAAGAAPAQTQPAQTQPAQTQPAQTQPAPSQPPAPAPEAAPPARPTAPWQTPPARGDGERTAPSPEPVEAQSRAPETAAGGNGQAPGGGAYVTPLVRKLAAEHRVDLSSLQGTGVGGRIRKQDVLDAASRQQAAEAQRQAAEAERQKAAAAAAPAPAQQPAAAAQPAAQPSPLRGKTEKMSRMRAIIAKRMVESLQISAQLTTVAEVDVTRVARLREQAKADFQARHGVKLSFLPFFALATVEALQVHPKLNASIDVEAGTVTYHDAEHLGMAVDTERGLMVPVIRSAGDLSLSGIAKRIADLAERTRTNKISPDELAGGTFTLTNTGSRGALFDTPIINQPQVAILGTGAVVKRAVVVDDPDLGELILPRSMVYLALTYDHRLVDGADAARFLTTVKERLEAGRFESELGLG